MQGYNKQQKYKCENCGKRFRLKLACSYHQKSCAYIPSFIIKSKMSEESQQTDAEFMKAVREKKEIKKERYGEKENE